MSLRSNTCDLSSCFLCRNVLPEWKELIALHKQTTTFKKSEALFSEGAPVRGVYLLLAGAVKVHKHWSGQKELTIRFAAAGDIIGLRGIGSPDAYPVSATALEQTKACFVSADFLETSLKVNPALAYSLFHFAAVELQRSEKRMSELALMDVKGRIAGALLAARQVFGKDSDGYIKVAISRQDIASYAGTIYETVFKVFTEWIAAGIINTEGKRIKLILEDRLEAFTRV